MKPNYTRFFMMALAVLVPFFSIAQNKVDTDKALKGFDKFVEKGLEDWNVPGVAIAIVKDGEVIMAKGYGYKDVENKKAVTPKTQFAIGSSSKAFTAATIAMLVDDGLLEFDEPIKTYIPNFRMYDEYVTNNINARDLLCHRSGLPRHDLAWYGSDKPREELMAALPYLEPTAKFREAWQYQNLMFMTAGYLVEQVTGQTWEQFTQQRIFDPLEMTNSNFSVIDMQKTTDFALPYREEDGNILKMEFRNIDAIGPAGSINASIEDMAKWLKFQLDEGKVGEEQLIQPSTFQQMHVPQMVMPSRLVYDELHHNTYGMGWFINSYRGHARVEHGGNIDGFSASVGMLPRDGIGVVVLTNKNGTSLTSIIRNNVFDRLLGLEEIDWNDRLKQASATSDNEEEKEEEYPLQKKNTTPSHDLADYVGDYTHKGYGKVSTLLSNDSLFLEVRGFKSYLKHYHYDVFKCETGILNGSKVAFTMNIDGDIETLSIPLESGIDDIVFTKMITAQELTAEDFEKYIGDYEQDGVVIVVALKDENTLTVTVPGQPTYTLVPHKEHHFKLKDLDGFSTLFKIDENGECTAITFNQPNGVFTIPRKK